jgi:mycothiol synthase
VAPGYELTATNAVSSEQRRQVLAIEHSALDHDGVSPLDDAVRLDLEFGAGTGTHVLATEPEASVVGYAHVTRDDSGAGSGHVVVAPAHRRRGIGSALLERLASEVAPQPLQVWAHGDSAAARTLARSSGFRRVRDLWQMRRRLDGPLAEPAYPAEVTVRTFRPGEDDEAWVALNATAFAEHPEQGRLTVDDLHHRMAQPWFDPAGLFLAERGGDLVGFHWTKVHPAGDGEPAVGEVYAVGVHPSAQGLGLGKALTLTGLHHLASRGLGEVLLYVDAANRPAVRVYERLGFVRTAVDVMYQRP